MYYGYRRESLHDAHCSSDQSKISSAILPAIQLRTDQEELKMVEDEDIVVAAPLDAMVVVGNIITQNENRPSYTHYFDCPQLATILASSMAS